MNIYIAYDRYEHDEWYSVYHIETNKERAIKHFKEVDLVDFISYGPDDCHSFQLQKVVMPKKDYLELRDLVENNSRTESELKEFLMGIYDESAYDVETIMSTDGCSDCFEAIRYYCEQNGLDYENLDDQEEAQNKLFNDDELFDRVLREYINIAY